MEATSKILSGEERAIAESGRRAGEPFEVLLLGGRPIGEPVVQYGPFVMNTEAEIRRAILDYQAGRMGEIAQT